MLGFIVVLLAAAAVYYTLGGAPALRIDRNRNAAAGDTKVADLTEYATRLQATNKYLAAEKVYLQILKINHKHAPTYVSLGNLYGRLKNYRDAIDCHQIAAQLAPSASTHYNLGLSLYENKNYMKAVAAFEKSIMFEPSVQRYIALAKSFQRLHDTERMVRALEQAADMDPQPKTLWLLADAYTSVGKPEEAMRVKEKISTVDPANERLRKEPPAPKATTVRVEKTPVK